MSLVLSVAPGAVAYLLNDAINWIPISVIGLIVGALTLLAARMPSPFCEYVLSFCLVASCVLFTAAFTGHPWQIDSDMLFFAVLAVISPFRTLGALLFGAALIAVHHLSLSFLLPSLVYPVGTGLGNLNRTILHALIVAVETVVLFFATKQRLAADLDAQAQRQTAEANALSAQEATRVSREKQESVENVMRLLEAKLNELAQGDLTAQIDEDLPDGYEDLRRGYNETLRILSETMTNVAETSQSILHGASEITQASDDLSNRTENHLGCG